MDGVAGGPRRSPRQPQGGGPGAHGLQPARAHRGGPRRRGGRLPGEAVPPRGAAAGHRGRPCSVPSRSGPSSRRADGPAARRQRRAEDKIETRRLVDEAKGRPDGPLRHEPSPTPSPSSSARPCRPAARMRDVARRSGRRRRWPLPMTARPGTTLVERAEAGRRPALPPRRDVARPSGPTSPSRADLATESGTVTNAVHGFTSMLVNIVREHGPAALAVAFDLPGPTFRDELVEDYKAGRAETPDDLPPQFDLIREVLGVAQHPRRRACPATRPTTCWPRWPPRPATGECDVVVVTGDRDCFQLVEDPHVKVLYNRRGVSDYSLYDEAGSWSAPGVAPCQVPDAGVPAGRPLGQPARRARGGGEDRGQAPQHLRRPRRHLRPPRRPDAQAARRTWPRTRRRPARNFTVIPLVRDVPLDVTVDELTLGRLGPEQPPEAAFERLELRTLWRRSRASWRTGASGRRRRRLDRPRRPGAVPPAPRCGAETSRRRGRGPAAPVVDSRGADAARPRRRRGRGRRPTARWCGPGGALGGRPGRLAAPRWWPRSPARRSRRAVWLEADRLGGRRTLARPHVRPWPSAVAGHQVKELLRSLLPWGIDCAGLVMDTAVAAYLLDPSTGDYRLGSRGGGRRRPTSSARRRRRRPGSWRWTSRRRLGAASGADEAAAGWPAGRAAAGAARGRGAARPPRRGGAAPGAGAGPHGGGRHRGWTRAELRRISDELVGRVPAASRTRSTSWPATSSTSTRPRSCGRCSTTSSASPRGARPRPATRPTPPPWRRCATSTRSSRRCCATARWRSSAPPTARACSPRWRPTGGSTPRSARRWPAPAGSPRSGPNLHNIPVRTELGRRFRRAFVPAEGCQFLVADYDQIELRVIAHLSGDPGLVEAFAVGADIHRHGGRRASTACQPRR